MLEVYAFPVQARRLVRTCSGIVSFSFHLQQTYARFPVGTMIIVEKEAGETFLILSFFLKAFRNNLAYFRFLKKSVANLKIRLAIISMKIPMPKVVLEIVPVKFQ